MINKLKVLTVAIFKGGCGVTTISKALIENFSRQNYKLLVVDLNDNTQLFNAFITEAGKDKCVESITDREDDLNVTSKSLFLKSNIVHCEENIDVLLVDSLRLMRTDSNESTSNEMKCFFASVASEYDIVIIDTPPIANFSVCAAIDCSTHVLIPIVSGQSEIDGANRVINLCENINKNRKNDNLINITIVHNKLGKVSRFDKLFFLEIQSDPVFSKYLSPFYLSNWMDYTKILAVKKSIFDFPEKNKVRQQVTEFCHFILEQLLSTPK